MFSSSRLLFSRIGFSHKLFLCSPLYLCLSTAYADTPRQGAPIDIYSLSLAELGQVQVSIATGNSTPLDKAPATASVIYAAEIEAMGARTLDDVLETVPGLHISLSSLSRLDSVESIRGIHTGFNPQVLMLLNGVPVQYSTSGGRPTLFRLPTSSIDRVEVIRGPGSAVYGADAYAGVINVITKDAASIRDSNIGFRSGSFNSHDFWLQAATSWNEIGVAFESAYQESDGDNHRKIESDLQTALDAALGTHASLAPNALSTRYQVWDTRLSLTGEQVQVNLWNWLSTNAGVGAGAAQALDPAGRDDSDLLMGDLTYHFEKFSDNWDNSIRASYMHYEQEARFTLLPAGTVVPIGKDGNVDFVEPSGVVAFPDGLKGSPGGITKDTQLSFISIYTGFDSQRIRCAIGTRRQSVDTHESKNFGPGVLDQSTLPSAVSGELKSVTNTAYIFMPNSSRTVGYLSLQDEWKVINNLDLTMGVRYDDYSDFGNTTNPRIALVWTADENLTAKLLLGSAFRAPSFAELYNRNNPVSLGKSDLQPEKINTEELSFNYRITQDLQTTLTLFKYQAKKMIDFVADVGVTTKTAKNINAQDGKGFELEMNWKPSNTIHVGASYSLQDAVNVDSDKSIPDAPGRQFKTNVNWMFASNWALNSQLYWIGDRERVTGDLRPAIKNYTLLNFTLNRKNILPELDLSLAVHNAANADAREPSSATIKDDYPLESRSVWLGLTYTFK